MRNLLLKKTLYFWPSFKYGKMSISEPVRILFERGASLEYFGENVTQLEHALQMFQLAKEANADEELAVAAFLHDIGHLLPVHKNKLGAEHHDFDGAAWLHKQGFSRRVVAITAQHVNAKRYLCFKNPEYYSKLSEASKQTLELQGGKMTEKQALSFEKQPHFDEIIQVRLWDEEAKIVDAKMPDLAEVLDVIDDLLT